MRIADLKVRPVSFPLALPFKTTLGARSETRNVLAVLDCGDLQGYGEASTSLAIPEATAESLERTLNACARLVRGRRLEDWKGIASDAARRFPRHPTARAALECALLDAWCRWKGMPLYRYFGRRPRPVQTHYTISALPPARCRKVLAEKIRAGFRKFKVKVTGKDPAQDLRRVLLASRSAPRSPVLVDANQAWTRDSALRFLDRLHGLRVPVSLVEQPLPKRDLRGARFVRERSPFPVAADESCRTFEDARRIVEEGAADCVNLKLAKSGLLESLRIARYALKSGLRLMIGCMMESAAGLAVPVHWACGTGDFSFVDLDSFLLMRPTGIRAGFRHSGPRLSVSGSRPGSGTELPL